MAVLLATLSYTGVLTPPHEIADCQDLCPNSMLKFGVALLESQLYVQNLTSDVKSLVTPGVTESVDAIVTDVLNQDIQVNLGGTRIKRSVSPSLQAFLALNGIALLASLSCLIIAGVRSIHADDVAQYKSIQKDCLGLVLAASVAVWGAFIAAHQQVYYLDSICTGLIVLYVCAALSFLILIFGCFYGIAQAFEYGARCIYQVACFPFSCAGKLNNSSLPHP